MQNRRSLIVLSLLALVLVLGVWVSGCGDDTTETTAPGDTTATTEATDTTAEAGEATDTTAPAAGGETVKLKYSQQDATTGWAVSNASEPWLDLVEEACNGRVEFEPFFGQTLMTGADSWEGLKAGIADASYLMHQYWAGLTPLAEVITLPFMPYDSGELGGAVVWQLYEEFPAIQEQFSAVHPVALWTSTPFYLLTTKKEVRTPEDMKGLKIRTLGGPPTKMVEAIGGAPVSMPQPDVYQALQTGVLDGVLANWEGIYSFRLYEVGKYLTMVPFHTGLFGVSFNNESWNGLPADVKSCIESQSYMEGSRFFGKNMFDTAAAAVKDLLVEEGYELTYIEPTPEEIETLWQKPYGEPLWEEWVTDMESQGHSDARAILTRALELVEQGLPQ